MRNLRMVNFYDFGGCKICAKRGSCIVWEINMGVCPRLKFDNNMFVNCLGYTFIFMVHLSFYAFPLLINNVMYDITTIP